MTIIHEPTAEDQQIVAWLQDVTSTDQPDDMEQFLATALASHREVTAGDEVDLLGESNVDRLWAVRIRTWDETMQPWDERGSHWMEPSPCTCRYPHGYRPQCRRCTIEYMAKARRTWDPDHKNRKGDDAPRWVYDAEGEFGAHFQSSEINGFRAHVVHFPTHGSRHLGTWLLVITEFLYEQPQSFTTHTGEQISYMQRARDVVGFQEVYDRDEGIYQAQDLVEQWRITEDNLRNGWDNVPLNEGRWTETAIVSPDMLDRMAEQPGAEIIA